MSIVLLKDQLKGASIEETNCILKNAFREKKLKKTITFEPFELQNHVNNHKSFGKGLVSYLEFCKKELNNITTDEDFKKFVLQILSELGSLVFSNTSACYPLVPKQLKKIDWKVILKDDKKLKLKDDQTLSLENNKSFQLIMELVNLEITQNKNKIACLISLSVSKILIQSIKKNENALLVDDKGKLIKDSIEHRPRVKSAVFLSQLTQDLETYLIGLYVDHLDGEGLTKELKIGFKAFGDKMAKSIIELLLKKEIFLSFSTIQNDNTRNKNPNYYVWNGSNLLMFPKTLALPMLIKPNEWIINSDLEGEDGGYLLSAFAKMSYQGNKESKSFRNHAHKLELKCVDSINRLQNVPFCINNSLLEFLIKNKGILTEKKLFLMDDTWINVSEELLEKLDAKWLRLLGNGKKHADIIAMHSSKEQRANYNETLRNQEILQIAGLYSGKEKIYWPVIQDFRGRVYRIGNLNIQLKELVRSLIAFPSDKPFVNRKKNKYTLAKYHLLLKEVLVEEHLIKQWDAVFGNRLINNDQFEKLLLEDLIAEKLSIIQVGQLLLIRQGAYDQVGVFYDASASAYQVMGVINGDRSLCELTNVLNKDGTKQDIYSEIFKKVKHKLATNNNYTLNKENLNNFKIYKELFLKKADRAILKAIIMPLVYGKTGYGFKADLREFFRKIQRFPANWILMTLANEILNAIKSEPVFSKSIQFMQVIRAIAGELFEENKLVIKGPFHNSKICYYKEEEEHIKLFYKKGIKYKSQQITLSRPKRDEEGNFIKSKKKAVNAFVANYVHFLDACVCHTVIQKLSLSQKSSLALGTIHDCFFIKPDQFKELRETYLDGLVEIRKIHTYNMINWLYDISYRKNNESSEKLIECLRKYKDINKGFETTSNFKLSEISLDEVKSEILSSKLPFKKRFSEIIQKYFKDDFLKDALTIEKSFASESGQVLFSDNK